MRCQAECRRLVFNDMWKGENLYNNKEKEEMRLEKKLMEKVKLKSKAPGSRYKISDHADNHVLFRAF